MSVAQGINKLVAYKVQAGLGTAASGSGGQLVRRRTSAFNVSKQTYENDEIASHQQGTGITHGIRSTGGSIEGLLSPSTYADFQAALLRKAWAATSAISSLSLTIAASGAAYTITRASGDFLSGGIKIGDVIRLSGGSLNVANAGVNLVVAGVTATVLTVFAPKDVALVAEGPIASSTVTVVGKKTWAPISGHTNLYYTIEEWFADISRSDTFPDMQPSEIAISIAPTGNVTHNTTFVGLGKRVRGGAQVLTSPTAETTTEVVGSINGRVVIGGAAQAVVTSATINISGNVQAGEAAIGSNTAADTQRGRIVVSGSFTAIFESVALANAFDTETTTSLIFMLADDGTPGADFFCITLPEVKLSSDEADDGEKQIIRTYNFTAQKCTSGGAAAANHPTIISLQDSTIA